MSDWTIFARDGRTLTREVEIDDHQGGEFISRFNAVGAWNLTVGPDQWRRIQERIDLWDLGISLRYRGQTVFNGPIVEHQHQRRSGRTTVALSGVSDEVWLLGRLASPQPGTGAPPYSATESDVRTGVASTVLRQLVDVNAGPSAIIARRVPGIAFPADELIGSQVTARARWDVLLTLLQTLAVAGGGLRFFLRQEGNLLAFRCAVPADKSGVVSFSEDKGTLGDHTITTTRPDATHLYVGGPGEGTARTIAEVPDSDALARWGRIEQFLDARQSATAAELSQAADDHYGEQGERITLSLTPVVIDGQEWLTHWALGDRVSAVTERGVLREPVQQVRIVLSTDAAPQILPSIGTPGRAQALFTFRALRRLGRRVEVLERR